jgi:N-acetylglucosamine malate deacetylase 2
VEGTGADGVIVFDRSGVTGHPDHAAATAAALRVAARVGLPALEWTLPQAVAATLNAELGANFTGHPTWQIDLAVAVDRAKQRAAIAAHASQATPDSPVWRRLDLLGDREFLRLLSRTSERRAA